MLRGSQRRWLDYLHERRRADRRRAGSDDPDVAARPPRAPAVIANHHNLLLGAARAGAAHRRRPRRLHAEPDYDLNNTTTDEPMTHDHTARHELTAEQLELSDRARDFVEEVLMPLEIEAEERGGRAARGDRRRDQAGGDRARACTAAGCPSSTAARAGRCSSGSSSTSSSAASPTACTGTSRTSTTCCSRARPSRSSATSLPALRGEGGDAYAVTEAEAGSDPGGIASTAVATDGGWRINGEKWFVTSGDVARVLIVMANVVDGADRLPTLFLVEPDAPGVEFVDDPQFTHNYPHGHPTIRFTDVEVEADAVIGGIGNGEELQRALVHRGAARDRDPRPGRDVAAARRDHRAGR